MSLLSSPRPRRFRDRVLRLAELATTPLVPADYLDLIDPLRCGRRPARPDRGGPARDRRRRHHRDPPGRRLGRPRARPVRPDRHRRRRRPPVARLLPDPRPARRRPHLDHRQGRPGRQGQQPPRARRHGPAPWSTSSRRPASSCSRTEGGKFLFVTAGSGITPVIGMLRNLFPVADAGVVRLAAQRRLRHRRRARRPERARLDLPRPTSASSTRPV